jgi:trimethylamine:corrinoid methyltransferase-like protein
MRTRARERVFEIWETHEVPSLPADVIAGMDEIIERRRAATA